jgi:hypothetical protein
LHVSLPFGDPSKAGRKMLKTTNWKGAGETRRIRKQETTVIDADRGECPLTVSTDRITAKNRRYEGAVQRS